ncbi:MAG: NERD domain-containing protein [Clostridium sp.]|nr:NERD domain-containing protein [Bacteroides sp.]MCM1198197.1 NERD domain-containing protein [Clostridium sp.]
MIPTLINKCGIDPRAIYHDLYLRKSNGTYTQIDLVVALPQGLVVFEVKDYSGWIFGNERSKYWMQIMAYGQEKHQFYNPIWQNNSHITALRNAMPNNHGIEIFNIVVFHGNCEFKDVNYSQAGRTRVIYNTQVARVIKNIKTLTPTNYGNKREVAAVLSAAVRNGKDLEIRAAQMAYASRNSYNGNTHHEYSTRWFRVPSQRTLRKRMLRNIFK